MKKVKVSDLKAKLASYLRCVKKGDRLVILERNIAVAQIVPIESKNELEISAPTLSVSAAFSFIQSAAYKKRPTLSSNHSMRILEQERRR